MAALTITLGFKSPELRNLDLPIEIRKPNSTLIARALPSKPVELKAGQYYATASLPGGQQMLRAFEMPNQDFTIELAPEKEDESSHEWQEVAHYMRAPKMSQREQAAPSADPAFVRARFRMFSGNPVTGPLALTSKSSVVTVHNFEQGRVVQFRVNPQGTPLIAQLIEPGGAVHNMTVPVTPFNAALLVFTRRPDSTCAMDGHLEHATADMLLQYSGASATAAAEETGRSLLRDAERLLSDKRRDPIAAAVAATAILRFGELKWLHEWTANLDQWFKWLPDGAAIHGEHLARRGRHADAAARFFDVPERGLPLISDAFFYAVERLKWYVELKPEHAAGIDQDRAKAALDKLRPFAGLVHRQRPLTSYPGLDPRTPSADVGSAAGQNEDAIELAEWLGEGPGREGSGSAARTPGRQEH